MDLKSIISNEILMRIIAYVLFGVLAFICQKKMYKYRNLARHFGTREELARNETLRSETLKIANENYAKEDYYTIWWVLFISVYLVILIVDIQRLFI